MPTLHPSAFVARHAVRVPGGQQNVERAKEVVDHPLLLVVVQQPVLGDDQRLVLLTNAHHPVAKRAQLALQVGHSSASVGLVQTYGWMFHTSTGQGSPYSDW